MAADRIKMELAAPRDLVWDAWTKPEYLSRWLCERAEVECRVGGVYCLWNENESMTGRVFSVDRPRLLHIGRAQPEDELEFILELFPTLDGTRIQVEFAGFQNKTHGDIQMQLTQFLKYLTNMHHLDI